MDESRLQSDYFGDCKELLIDLKDGTVWPAMCTNNVKMIHHDFLKSEFMSSRRFRYSVYDHMSQRKAANLHERQTGRLQSLTYF